MNYYKFTGILLIFAYCLYYTSTLNSWHFIDNVDLIIHEAGHVVFLLLGEFLHILRGSLLQIFIPLTFAIYFYINNKQLSASVMMFWAGLNFLNVSDYASDALKMQLPLLGGDYEGHDWNQLLFKLGWLRHTALVGDTFFWWAW